MQFVFDDYFTAIWCVVITMTTVGYGDVTVVSPYGRNVSILNCLWGSFIVALLMGMIQQIFALNEKQLKAVKEITNSKQAAKSVKSFVQYINGRVDHVKNRDIPVANRSDYVNTKEDVKVLKEKMLIETELF